MKQSFLLIALSLGMAAPVTAVEPQPASERSIEQASAASSAIQVRRNMGMREFSLVEFSEVLSRRQPLTYQAFSTLSSHNQQAVLDAFNSGTNVTQLKALIDYMQ